MGKSLQDKMFVCLPLSKITYMQQMTWTGATFELKIILLLLEVSFASTFEHLCHTSPSSYYQPWVFLMQVKELVFWKFSIFSGGGVKFLQVKMVMLSSEGCYVPGRLFLW